MSWRENSGLSDPLWRKMSSCLGRICPHLWVNSDVVCTHVSSLEHSIARLRSHFDSNKEITARWLSFETVRNAF